MSPELESIENISPYPSTKITLPSIISSERDFEIIQYHTAKPNYITEKTISERIINLDISKSTELENKIILLEHADPGYDWIFAKNPLGLITKYGGVASHMSIRCSELGLPAAIACRRWSWLLCDVSSPAGRSHWDRSLPAMVSERASSRHTSNHGDRRYDLNGKQSRRF